MHPVLIEIGPLSIRYYGLMYVLGIIAAIFLIRSEVRRKGLSLTDDDQTNLLLLTVFAGIIGAGSTILRLIGRSIANSCGDTSGLARWVGHPWGVIGGTCAVFWFARRKRIPVLRLMDVLAPPLIWARPSVALGIL